MNNNTTNRKVVIIGAGHVGSHAGYALVSQNLVEEFVDDLIDFKKVLIKYDYYLENLFADRVMAIENLKLIEELLFKNLCENLYVNESYRIDFYEVNIALIEREKENLKYNINIKIWLSNYIFQIMEVSNV